MTINHNHQYSYTKTYRYALNLENINRQITNHPNDVSKDHILQKFIDSIPKSTADYVDYVKYLFIFIFKQPDTSCAVNREQKECIRYLCSNERFFFSQYVTRGQIKLWYVLFNLTYRRIPKDFNDLVEWIIHERSGQSSHIKEETSSFLSDLSKCKKYFDTIHEDNGSIILGKGEYKNASYHKSNLFSAPIDRTRYAGPNGIRNLIFDNMIDPEKLAAAKKKYFK